MNLRHQALRNLAPIVIGIAIVLFLAIATDSHALTSRPIKIAVLDFGNEATGMRVAELLRAQFATSGKAIVVDADAAKAAARGTGYAGSLNMSLEEARDLGAAIGCDFFVVGDAQTLRRSPSTGSPYFESFASVFLVSARSGKLVLWEKTSVRADTSAHAEAALILQLTSKPIVTQLSPAIEAALAREATERAERVEKGTPVIEVMSEDAGNPAGDKRPPRPFRRLKPEYPPVAAESQIEAVVDVLVDVDDKGEVERVEVSRWAGYELDESVIATVKQLHFFPAMRAGRAIPMRVLLRYNFRKPPPDKS